MGNMIKKIFIVSLILFSIVGCYGPSPYVYHNSSTSTMYVSTTPPSTIVDLDPPVWDDLQISMANAKVPAANAPTWRDYLQTQVPAFSASQVNVLYFTAQLPHSYKEGSNVEFHIHTVYPDALAGNLRWYFTCSWANIDGTFPAASSFDTIVASPTTINSHKTVELITNLDGTGKKISSVFLCSIQRSGNHVTDTYPSEIYLVSGDFHFQKDTIGSRTRGAK